ncbi:MAG: NAD(P)-binding domain-containing protein, partial [Oxalobacter sp.]|nr:NAD(P)-binding domain-containing protein [Oxalobacter sp.]
GQMGAAMAARLVQAGFSVCVYNRTIEKCEPLQAMGASVAKTPAEAVTDASIILPCWPILRRFRKS